jgi:hypothetical protein
MSVFVVPLHVLDEDTLELSEAAKLLGPKVPEKKAASLAKMVRAVNPGVKSDTGEIVRLEAVKTGGAWLTSRQAVERFVTKLSEASLSQDRSRPPKPKRAPVAGTIPARRERELAQTNSEVDAMLNPPPRRRGRRPRAEKGG